VNRSTEAHTLARGIGLFAVATLLGALANVAAPPPVAHAATIQVDTTDDELNSDFDCSLREAIQAANTNSAVDNCTAGQAYPNLDIITFSAATNGIPIVLVGAAGEDANATGDLDILDGGDLTIQGNDATNTIIDGNDTDRVFHVCPGGGCANTVTLTGVTIRNGSADFGGGIQNLGATLNVQDSTIGGAGAGNTASDEGGGIDNQNGTTTVDGTTVSANRAEYGGGICNHATLNLQNSTVGGAGASNSAESGGGIYNSAGSTTLDASTVISNIATDGGGIYSYAGTTMVDASTVVSNTATDDGGGIYVEGGTTTLEASTVISNTAADDGGGIYNHATLNVQNSTIGRAGASNTATSNGGGIHNFSGQTTVDSSTISGNEATHGAGIYSHYAATLNVQNGSTIGGAGAGNMATSYGGGIYNGSGGTMTVDASTVSANTASYGGGIFNDTAPGVQDGSTGTRDTAAGAGSILATATVNVQNGSIIGGFGAGNRATVSGGGIFNGTDCTTIVEGSTVISNTAISGGGGIFNWFGTTMVRGSTVISNTAGAAGGGINNYYGTMTVDGCRVSANTAAEGGGIYNHATLNVTNSTIGGAGAGNTAFAGGGIRCWFGTTTLYGSTVSANTATQGGGIYNDAVSTATAPAGGHLAAATLSIQNSTIGGAGIGNTATEAGGGIYNGYEFTMQVIGSRILHNTAPNGGGVFSWNELVGATSVTGSCIVGNSDISFFNDKAAQQTATGNWWGAAGGPGAPGADTVGGPVDTSGFLNTPILGCTHRIYLPVVLR
jgi:CSLREA domain-containing protein